MLSHAQSATRQNLVDGGVSGLCLERLSPTPMESFKAAFRAAAERVYNSLTPKRALSEKGADAAVQASPKHKRVEPQYEVCVIGDAEKRVQGNCVICHGTLLYLGEKQVPFTITKFLDESLSDPWLKTVRTGDTKMPLVRALGPDRWLCGTEAIWGHIEEAHPDAPDLGRPQQELSDGVVLGQLAPGMHNDRLFSLLGAVLTGADEAAAAQALKELEGLLRQLDDWLAEREMPFIGGDSPDATDCYLAPKLASAVVALERLRGWELPEDLQALHRYLVMWKERASWRQSCYDEQLALAFWQRKVEQAKQEGQGKQGGEGKEGKVGSE